MMSDQEVIELKEDIGYIKGKLDAVLPNLATKSDVLSAIDSHAAVCGKGNTKSMTLLVGAIVTLVGLVGAIVHFVLK
jgi:hypothetical protein